MKKTLQIFILLFLGNATMQAQQTIFHKIYGGGNFVSGQAVLQCPDSNLVVVGSINSNDGNLNDVLFFKLDTNGNVLLEKKYGGASIDIAKWAAFNHDSTAVLVVGFSSSFTTNDYDVYALYLDLNGDTIWTKTIGGSEWDYAYHVINTKDKGFLITGETYSYGEGNNDMYAIKIDTNGTIQWEKTIGGNLQDYAYSAVETADSNFVLIGSSNSYNNNGDLDFYASCLNQLGDSVWTKTYGSTSNDYGTSNCLYFFGADSLIILAGYAIGEVSDTQHFYIIDYNGNEKRHDYYNALELRHTVIKPEPDTSGYYFTIQRKDYEGARVTPFFVIYSANFYFSNLKAYDITRDSYTFNSTKMFDGGYVLVGETESCGTLSSTSLFVYKVDQALNASINISNNCNSTVDLALNVEEIPLFSEMNLFPNPAFVNSEITIATGINEIEGISVFDMQGRKVHAQHNKVSGNTVMSTQGWNAGMYFIQLQSGENYVVKKLIVQ